MNKETGKNLPDITLINQICEDFNISFEELCTGKQRNTLKKRTTLMVILGTLILLGIIIFTIVFIINKQENFNFKTLSSNCENFNISGNIAYNNNKAAIYVTNIKYCGSDNLEEYKTIECILYESENDIERKISSYKYEQEKKIKLEDFLQQVTLTVEDYPKLCKEYKDNSLYLIINATKEENKIITYKIPFILKESCSK